MIVREFAVDPEIFDDPESLRNLLHTCGPEHGRYLTGLPESMLAELWVRITELGGVGQQVAEEFLRLVQHARLAADEGPWMDAVTAADSRLPYDAFLSGRTFSAGRFEQRRVDPRDPQASSVFEANSDEVERTPEALAAAIRPLLQTASLIKLVDPYFAVGDPRFMTVLEEFVNVAASTPYRSSGCARFEIHTALGGVTRDLFASRAKDLARQLGRLGSRRPWLKTVRFFVWSKTGWHDRYVLAKDAGLRFSVGLDAKTNDAQQSTTAINHLKKREIAKYWKQFDVRRPCRGEFLGEVKTVL